MFLPTLDSLRSDSFQDGEAGTVDSLCNAFGRCSISRGHSNKTEERSLSGQECAAAACFLKAKESVSHLWHVAADRFSPHAVSVVSIQGEHPLTEEARANQELFDRIFKQIEKDIRPDPKISKSSPKDPKAYVKRQEQLLLEHPDRVMKTAVRNILGHSNAIITVQEGVIGEDTWADLNLFSGHEASTLVHHIKRTSSELGEMYLSGLIGCPTRNVDTLRSRQDLIQALGAPSEGDSSLAQQIAGILGAKAVQDGERQLLSSWDPKLEYPGGISKMFYHVKGVEKIANESPFALDAGLFYNHVKKIAKLSLQAGSAGFMLYNAGLYCTNSGPSPDFSHLFKQVVGTRGPAMLLASYIPSPLATVGISLYGCAQTAMSLGPDIRWMAVDFQIDSILQKKFFGVASFYRAMKEVYTKLSDHPEVTKHLSHFNDLKAFFENKKLSSIFHVLESSTFNSEAAFLFRRGNVLYLLDQLMKTEVKEQFEVALKGIAEIDAFVSAAKLVDEFKDKRVHFCFPEYVEGGQRPILHMDNFWNVFVDPEKVVPNSLHFSPESPDQCHIITGPNGGGKTTVLRSSVGSIVLAQSLGIASASSLRMTPVTFTASSMNVADVQGEKSHFQAECDRMVGVRKRLDALRPNEFGFVVLDELYAGTSHEESSALVRSEVEGIGRRPNVLSMVVTHDDTLPNLAEQDPRYRNFKVVVDPEARPLFRIEEGVSNQHIALIVAARRGVDLEQLERAKGHLDSAVGARR